MEETIYFKFLSSHGLRSNGSVVVQNVHTQTQNKWCNIAILTTMSILHMSHKSKENVYIFHEFPPTLYLDNVVRKIYLNHIGHRR